VEVRQSDRSGDATNTFVKVGETAAGELPDLDGGGSLVIKMEDVYKLLGMTLPDTTAGGNVSAIITIRVTNASCAYQTFDESTSASFFGTANCTTF